MLIDSNQIVSMTEANQNFSKVARLADDNGSVVIFRNNKPKYILVDVESMSTSMLMSSERAERIVKKEIDRTKWL